VDDVHLVEFTRPTAGPLRALRIAASYLALARTANRLASRGTFDLLHVEYIETGLGLDARLPIRRVLVAHDELSEPAARQARLEPGLGRRLRGVLYGWASRHLEHHVCRKFDRILVASERNRQTLLAMNAGLAVSVLPFPIGIDPAGTPGIAREEGSLLFVGAMHRHPNVDAMRYFCRQVLPRVQRDLPRVRLTIVGNQPPRDLAQLTEDPRISVTGFVPALEPYYARATVFVSPIRIGGGIMLKNIDAMAAGCPVVTTSIGNEGVGATPGYHLVTADDPDAFARAVVRLLRDEGERRRLAEHGRQFVEARFSLDATVKGLEEAYREACR
jgi:glycosyltransferase involved in cell wall biosynthesis